jgi:hypothetical protein
MTRPRSKASTTGPTLPTESGWRGHREVLTGILCRNVPWVVLIVAVSLSLGCGAINPGKWKGLEKTSPDEQYYLLKDCFLSAGSAAMPRESFDHNVHESVNLFFIPSNEKNVYVAESSWQDPAGLEYRTIRTTYDKQAEGKQGIERSPKGSTRVHSLSTAELFGRKPGLWKVTLSLDGKLARRLNFFVR